MRRAAALAALALAAAVGVTVPAQAKAPGPPKMIRDATATRLDYAVNMPNIEADLEERAPKWMSTPTAKMFTRIDVNGDGIDDWRVDYEKAPVPSYFCGTGGCRQEIWVSEPGSSWRRVMGVGVRDLKLTRKGGVTRLDLDFHGTACGGYGAQECPRSYLWDEKAGYFVETAGPVGQTWLWGGPLTLEPPNLESEAPPAVLTALERMQMECGKNEGGFDPEWNVTRIPDLDGDGVRDWVVGSEYAACEYDMVDAGNTSPPLPVFVIVSAGGGDGLVAYEGMSLAYGVDMSVKPARLYVVPKAWEACKYEVVCGKPLRWDAASKRLVE